MTEQSNQRTCLFNCDNTYKLDVVERFLMAMKEKHGLKISIEKFNFRLNQMTEISDITIPQLQIDIAIFVVHAHESRLLINEDIAGIGYAKIYRALLKATGGKVLIVIGGDDQYKGEDEEERVVISRWARRKVAPQFNEEYLDGRKSFIFSWNKQHREIHEEALLHYFDPGNKGQKFEYQRKQRPEPVKREEPDISPLATGDIDIHEQLAKQHDMNKLLPKDENEPRYRAYSDEEEQKHELRSQEEHAAGYGATDPVPRTDFPANTVLLDTRMRHGVISYKTKHILKREKHWEPSNKHVSDLLELHNKIRDARVQFIREGNGGIHYEVIRVTSCCPWC